MLYAVEHAADVAIDNQENRSKLREGCGVGGLAVMPGPGNDNAERNYRRYVHLTCCNTALMWTVAGYYMVGYLNMVSY